MPKFTPRTTSKTVLRALRHLLNKTKGKNLSFELTYERVFDHRVYTLTCKSPNQPPFAISGDVKAIEAALVALSWMAIVEAQQD